MRFDYGTLILLPAHAMRLNIEHVLEASLNGASIFLVTNPQTVIARLSSGDSVRVALPIGSILVDPNYAEVLEEAIASTNSLILNRPEWIEACKIGCAEDRVRELSCDGQGILVEGRVEPREPKDPVALFISGYDVEIPSCIVEEAVAAATVRGAFYYGYGGDDSLLFVKGKGPAQDLLNYILPLYANCCGR